MAGTDASDEFNAIHSAKAKRMLADYYIGDLGTAEEVAAAAAAAAATVAAPTQPIAAAAEAAASLASAVAAPATPVAAAECIVGGGEAPVALNPRKRIPFTLVQKDELSHNVRRFRFALQSPQHRFGLPVGKHVFLYAK